MSMRLLLLIVGRHLTFKPSRTFVAVAGVALGVAFMVTLSALMTGFQTKFVRETIEVSPHITVTDEALSGALDFPAWAARDGGLVSVSGVRPREPRDGIKKPSELLAALRSLEGVEAAAPNVVGSALLRFSSKERGATILGIEPENQEAVLSIEAYLGGGRVTDLYSAGGAVFLGAGLADKLGVTKGDAVVAQVRGGRLQALKVVGIFRTGIVTVDDTRVYVLLTLAQQLLGAGRTVNRLVVRLVDYQRAFEVARSIEELTGYRAESWQEANSNFLSIFVIQQTITYLVTGGIMIVAAFGIFNMLVMIVVDKYPEIAMLKSIGYTAGDLTAIFFIEGLLIGLLGTALGALAGWHMVEMLGRLPVAMKGFVQSEHLVMNNAPVLYAIAGSAAIGATMLAAVLPAVKAGRLDPVAILRGHS